MPKRRNKERAQPSITKPVRLCPRRRIRLLSGHRGCRKSTICRSRRKTKFERIAENSCRSSIPKPSAGLCLKGLPPSGLAAMIRRQQLPLRAAGKRMRAHQRQRRPSAGSSQTPFTPNTAANAPSIRQPRKERPRRRWTHMGGAPIRPGHLKRTSSRSQPFSAASRASAVAAPIVDREHRKAGRAGRHCDRAFPGKRETAGS
jgi:hypothetical protein